MSEESYDTIREYWSLKEDVLFPFSDEHANRFPNELDSIVQKRRAFEATTARLPLITQEEINQCKGNLLAAINKVLEIISASKLGYPLARNQGLIIENYVYGKLLSTIMGAVKSPSGFGYSNFYYEKDGTFDAGPLIDLMNRFRTELINTQFNTYMEFADVYERYREEIVEMWREDNRRMHL